jgi:hypothetical protein
VVSPLDVLSAMEYKQDLERYKVASSLFHSVTRSCCPVDSGVFRNSDHISGDDGDDKNRKVKNTCGDHDSLHNHLRQWMEYERDRMWTKMQNRITTSGRMSTDEDVDSLITALQVKLAKDMSTQLLLKPSNGAKSIIQRSTTGNHDDTDGASASGDGDDVLGGYNAKSKNKRNHLVVNLPCSSTLLNMPTENYLSTFLPPRRFACVHRDGTNDEEDSEIEDSEEDNDDEDVDDDDDDNDDDGQSQALSSSSQSSSLSSAVGSKPYPSSGIKHRQKQAKLGIPANFLTSRELLRISSMMAKVPIQDLEAVHSSPLTYSVTTGFDYKHHVHKGGKKRQSHVRPNVFYAKERSNAEDKLLIGVSSTIRGTDLMALWVRAQRDTSASRHLLALFDITPCKRDETQKQQEKPQSKDVIDLNSVESDNEDAIEMQQDQQHSQQQQQQGNKQTSLIHGVPKEISFTKKCMEKTPSNNNYSMSTDHEPYYTATYVGNPSKMRMRIEKESPILDKLTEWAVMNQILYTQEYMRERVTKVQHGKTETDVFMEHSSQKERNGGIRSNLRAASANSIQMNSEKSRKRSSQTNFTIEESNRKRPRSYSDISPPELQVAYQSYILRWFVRRNYDALKIVLTSKKNPSGDEDSDDEGSVFKSMTTQIKNYLRDKYASTDRTFDRIDRRILIGKFSSFGMFVDAVDQLLEALGVAFASDKSSLIKIDNAKTDFYELCRSILSGTGRNDAIGTDNCSLKETIKFLRALPRPWHDDKCHSCNVRANRIDRVICQNCGMCMHKDCLPQQPSLLPSPSLNDDTLKYLKGIYFSSEKLPCTSNFISNPIAWEKKIVIIQRERVNGNTFPKWGLTLQNTEQCEQLYNKYFAYLLSPNSWDQAELRNSTFCETYLMKLPHSGLLITKCVGPALSCGLKEGDVIVEIEIFGNDANHCVLKDVKSSKERQKYFQVPNDKIVLTICRPSKDIIAIAKNFRDVVMNVHSKVAEVHHKLTDGRWYCDPCKKSYSLSSSSSSSISDEASVCQRVLRRLAMEECFLPFHDEFLPCSELCNHHDKGDDGAISIESDSSNEKSSTDSTHLKHICLRRLDQIMELIKGGSFHGKSVIYTPPWCLRERLCWVNKTLLNNPKRLLCTGMFLIIESAKSNGYDREKLDELIATFIRTFVSTYFDGIGDFNCYKGLDIFSARKFLPWLSISCEKCFVRPAQNTEFKCHFCTNSVMVTAVSADTRQLPEFKSHVNPSDKTFDYEKVLSHEVIKYDLNSSFVGTSFIVDMDDPLIFGVCQKTKLKVDEGRRNVELLIVSYVPKELLSIKERGYLVYEEFSEVLDERWRTADGLFFILPILSYLQIDFISKFCQIQVANKCPSESEMLKLEGIIAMTPSELVSRLQRSSHMVTAVNRAVASIVVQFGSAELPMMIFEKKNKEITESHVLACDCHDTLSALSYALTENESSNRFFETCFFSWAIDYVVSSPTLNTSLILSEKNRQQYVFSLQDRGYFSPDGAENCKIKHFRELLSDHGNDSSSMLSILYGLVAVEPFPAQKNGECELCYTDLVNWEPRNKNRMTKSEKKMTYAFKQMKLYLSQISLLKPACALTQNNLSEYEEISIVMHRECDQVEGDYNLNDSDSDEEYSPRKSNNPLHNNECPHKFYGKGWGLELVRWSSEKHLLRVGRIAPSSPAEKSGLRPHDVVKCINGIVVRDSYHSNSDIANILLGEVCIVEKSKKIEKGATIPYLHELRNKAPVRGPVVLNILRSEKNKKSMVENDVEESNTAFVVAPRSQTSRQTNSRPDHPQEAYQKKYSQIHGIAKHRNTSINQPPPSVSPIEILHRKHLYRTGVNDTFLTIAETAVMMMAIELNHPKLSLRLLSPRYPSHRVNEEYVYRIKPFLERNGMHSIPKLNQQMWNKVLEYDHLRIQKEDGPIIFYENNFGYREPKIRFPIDKLLENYFENNQQLQIQRPIRLGHPNVQETGFAYSHQSHAHQSKAKGDHAVPVNNHPYSYQVRPIVEHMNKPVKNRGSELCALGHRPSIVNGADLPLPSEYSDVAISATRDSDLDNTKSQSELHQYDRARSTDISRRNNILPSEDNSSENNLVIRGDVGNVSSTNTNATSANSNATSPNANATTATATTTNTCGLMPLQLNDPVSNLGKVVIGYDRTNKHNTLLGIVVETSPSPETCTVKFIHDTTSGIFSAPKICKIHSDYFYAIPGITCIDSTGTIIRKAMPYIRCLEKRTMKCDKMRTASIAFEGLNILSPSTLLGVLPDGRSLHWFSSDPFAVYIHDHEVCANDINVLKGHDDILLAFQKNSEKSKTLQQPFLDVPNTKNLIFCPWGCCITHDKTLDGTRQDYRLLTFSTISEWKEHIHTVHIYGSHCGHKTLRRINEGRAIRDLCADITMYLCSLSASIRRFTQNYHDDIGGYPMRRSIIIDPVSWRGLDYESLALFPDNTPLLLSVIKLWDRLDYLFCIEADGMFRFHERHQVHASIPQSLSRIHSDEMKLFKFIDNGLKDAALGLQTWNTNSFNTNSNCSLCRDCLKPIFKSKGSGIKNGVGCALWSNLCFDFDHSGTREKLLRATNDAALALSDLDVIKALLLNIAANVPRSLYASKMPMFTDSPKSNFWDDINIWITFVRRCVNTRMIAQAYVVLQSSINKQKMPKWWRTGKSGWSSSLVVLQNPTVSSISLHLFVLDSAISEFMANYPQSGKTSESYPHQRSREVDSSPQKRSRGNGNISGFLEELERLNFKERFKLLESLASKFGLPSHEGEYAEECMICDNGGELLCCEYCENVIHQECLGSTDELDDVPFVCSECICDIARLKESYDRGRE